MAETQLNYSNHPAKNNSNDIIVHSVGKENTHSLSSQIK